MLHLNNHFRLVPVGAMYHDRSFAQVEHDRTYSSVRVSLRSAEDMRILFDQGIDMEHFDGTFSSGIELVLDVREMHSLLVSS